MGNNIKENKKDNFVRDFTWRGITIPIYFDDYGQQMYTVLDGKEIGFGAYNSGWEYDAERLIDDKLDYICEVPNCSGAHLRWFDNAYLRDIVLIYRLRRIHIFLVGEEKDLTSERLEEIKKEATKILYDYVKSNIIK